MRPWSSAACWIRCSGWPAWDRRSRLCPSEGLPPQGSSLRLALAWCSDFECRRSRRPQSRA
jgi:hypothetical protein